MSEEMNDDIDVSLYGNPDGLKMLRDKLGLIDASEIEKLEFSVKMKDDFCFACPDSYYVVIGYKYDSHRFTVVEMTPYKYDNPECPQEVYLGYAWIKDGNSSDLCENAYRPVHPWWDDDVVLGWVPK